MAVLDTLARPRHVFTCWSLALPTLCRPLGSFPTFVARCIYTVGIAPLQIFSDMQDVGTGQVLYIYLHTISISWGGGAEREMTILLAHDAPLSALRRPLGTFPLFARDSALRVLLCKAPCRILPERLDTQSRPRGAVLDTLARPRHVVTSGLLAITTLRRPRGAHSDPMS